MSSNETSCLTDDTLGRRHCYPQPKREPDLPETEVRTKSEDTDFERQRYIALSETTQSSYWQVSIEEPVTIPIRVKKVWDLPLAPEDRSPDRMLELNVGSVEDARKMHEALGCALAEYDRHEVGGESA